jgi:hypothetical protein
MLFYTNEVKIAVTNLVMDLDRKDFYNSREKLDEISQKTVRKIKETINGCPTVLDTGNGIQIYQPINGIILDSVDGLKEYANLFDKYYLPNRFMKFAEQYFTNGKGDSQHNPTVKSCLMRIPWTINSKCNREVSILQEWDHHRPSIASILSIFSRYMSSQQEIPKQNLDLQVIHSGNSKLTSNQNNYEWIDVLLQLLLHLILILLLGRQANTSFIVFVGFIFNYCLKVHYVPDLIFSI